MYFVLIGHTHSCCAFCCLSLVKKKQESGYEALLHDDGIFYVVRESILHNEGRSQESYHAIIEELILDEGEALDYTVQNECSCAFEFEGDR